MIRNLIALTFSLLLIGAAPSFAFGLEVLYQVPTSDPSLVPFSNYSVDSNFYEITPQKIQVKLPATLTGEEQNFYIHPERDPGWWSGKGVRGMCSLKDFVITCHLRFDSVKVNLHKVRDQLRALNLSYGEVEARVRLSAKFSSEPIGVLQIRLPKFHAELMQSSGFFLP